MTLKPRAIIRHTLLLLLTVGGSAWAGTLPTANRNLHAAIVSGDIARVQASLAAGADPNRPYADFSTPLAWAVDKQEPQLVEILLAAGARPQTSEQSFSPLILACLRGNDTIVRQLLAAGATVNQRNAEGITPLALCAGNAGKASVEQLLDAGAQVDTTDQQGQTALMWAAAKGRTDTLRILKARGADINQVSHGGFTPLFFAIKSGSAETALTVLAEGGNPAHIGPEQTSAVQLAMYQQQYTVAEHLLDRGVDLSAYDRNGNQLLHAAIMARQPALVERLLAAGSNPNTPTGDARITWRYEVNFTSKPYVTQAKTPLLLAAERGSATMMRALVAAGADPSFVTAEGNNVLLSAAQSNPQALAYALQLNPDANARNGHGETALHRLLTLGTDKETTNADMAAMFALLADAGARTDIADRNGTTASDIASRDQFRAKDAFLATFSPSNTQK